MRITINCRSILKSNRTGIGRYTYHLIDSLGQIDKSNQYRLYAPKHLFDFKRQLPVFSYPNISAEYDFFNRGIKQTDICHLPSPGPLNSYNGKLIVTVHDLIHRSFPQGHTKETIASTERYMQDITSKADAIICTSQSTRTDLHRYYDYPQEKSTVVLNGVDHRIFYKIQDAFVLHPLLSRLAVRDDFILYVGTVEPRKNVQGVLNAMASLKAKGGKLPQLVIAGMRGWMMNELSTLINQTGLQEQVIMTGFLTDEELNILYNACTVFIFPSFYEGFGFPIVEAFCAGACVITSNTSSCGEIAAEAAVLVDPHDPASIAQALGQVLDNEDVRQDLKQKALKKGREFSFAATAEQTLGIYQRLFQEIGTPC